MASLILISTSGIFISLHYCHGQRSEISINKDAHNCCGTSCKHCKTTNKYVKINDVFKLSQETIHVYKHIQSIIYTSLNFTLCNNEIKTNHFFYFTSSPPYNQATIYKLIENYRL